MLCSEKSPVVRNFSEDGPFELCFERICDLTPAIFCGEDWAGGGQSILAVGCHLSIHMCVYDVSTVITWAVPHNKKTIIKKVQKQVSINRFLKRNLAHVGMVNA